MKTTAIFSAALLGASMFTYGALAQTDVPGSEAQIELRNAEERGAVADNPGMSEAEVAQPESETIVPGNESQRELNRAAERDAVADDDTVATGATTGPVEGESDVLVPGSGATFSPGEAPTTQSGEALQDEAPASRTQ